MSPQHLKLKQYLIQWKQVLLSHTFTLTRIEFVDKAGRNRTSWELYGEDWNGYPFLSVPALPKEFRIWISENIQGKAEENFIVYKINDFVSLFDRFEESLKRVIKIENLLKD